MCGIAGYFTNCLNIDVESLTKKVDTLMSTRGPDHSGIRFFDKAGLSCDLNLCKDISGVLWHRRLSIIDLSADSNQPMTCSFGNTIVFNGEIYNYLEIREELVKLGHKFTSKSDTEVILAAYNQWSISCFDRFIGMFAIAIVNNNKSTITFARDSLGIKPLYYSISDNILGFSSRADLTSQMIDNNKYYLPAVFNFIEYGLSDNDSFTMYEGINSLLPGEIRVYSMNNFECLHTGTINYKKAMLTSNSSAEYGKLTPKSEILSKLLLDSIKLHTRTDVGFCTTLSGGLDSTSIIGLLKENGIDDVAPFSYIPENKEISEEKWVAIASDFYKLNVKEIRYTDDDFWIDVDNFIAAADLPVNSMSMYSQYKIYEAISKAGHKVVLDGQGGDEMFAGYVQYLYYKGYEYVKKIEFFKFFKLLKRTKDTVSTYFMIRNILRLILYNSLPSFYNKLRSMGDDRILDHKYFKSRKAITDLNFEYETTSLKKKLINDLKFQDLPRLLRYADRASMQWSLESRVPFASQPILSFIENLENDDFVNDNGLTKSLFRSAVKDFLPVEIYNRKDKKGFNTDFKDILYSENMVIKLQDILQYKTFGFISSETVLNGLRRKFSYPPDKLWRVVSFILWANAKSLNE